MPQQQDPRDDLDDDDEEEEGDQVRERDLVEAYVAEHSLESSLNDVINQVVASRPEDPFLMMSSLLHARATAKRGIFYVEVSEVPDASGEPTVLVRLHTGKGVFEGCCSAETGGITDSQHTQSEIGDGESLDNGATSDVPAHKQRYGGRGYVKIAATAQELLMEKLVNMEPTDQSALDDVLLGLESAVGRNVSLATSLAICQAGAKYTDIPLRDYVARLLELPPENLCVPMPLFSVVNGGKYASNKLYAQEILLMPTSAASFADALQIAVEFNTALRSQLETRGVGFINRGAFGGFAPQLQTLAEVFQVLRGALDDVKARLEDPDANAISLASASPLLIDFGVDFAASEYVVASQHASDAAGQHEEDDDVPCSFIYNTDRWVSGSGGSLKTSDEMLDIVRSSVKELEITTVVDPFDGGDLKSFTALNSIENDNDRNVVVPGEPADTGSADKAGSNDVGLGGDPNCRVQIVGRSAVERHGLAALSEERACNTVLLVMKQFPTVSRLLQAVTNAQHLGFAVMLGASAGQLKDTAMLTAIATGAGIGQVKFGGVQAAECLDRYRRLLLASKEPGAPPFVGAGAFRR